MITFRELTLKLHTSCWACAVAGLLALVGVWAVLIEPRWLAYREIGHEVSSWQGPPGLKVAVASDWHFTTRALWRVTTVERATQIVADINAAKPDIVLLPGDFIASDFAGASIGPAEEAVAAVLGELKAPLGIYAVLGNHDWWHDGGKMRSALERRGIKVLENDAVALPGTSLWIAGVGDDFTGHSRPASAVSKVPASAQVLVLMHDPASLMSLPPVQGLVVAGHTHGGQVALPFYGALVVPGAAPRAWAYGWVDHAGNRMYVTSGVGVSILPVRFNRRPEWAMITIKSKENK